MKTSAHCCAWNLNWTKTSRWVSCLMPQKVGWSCLYKLTCLTTISIIYSGHTLKLNPARLLLKNRKISGRRIILRRARHIITTQKPSEHPGPNRFDLCTLLILLRTIFTDRKRWWTGSHRTGVLWATGLWSMGGRTIFWFLFKSCMLILLYLSFLSSYIAFCSLLFSLCKSYRSRFFLSVETARIDGEGSPTIWCLP